MGLDQYAFARKKAEDSATEEEDVIQIATWRKHANLEGWMSSLFRERGGTGDFNCIELRLFEKDLATLEQQYQTLDTAEGFFWGESRLEDDDRTLAFINQAKELMADGYEIIYSSWW